MASELSRFLSEGVRLFNARDFFEAHEVWEEGWHVERGERKRFLQGLIQAAAAFHKLEEQNPRGLHKLLLKSIRNLDPFRPSYAGLDIEALHQSLNAWNARALDMIASRSVTDLHGFPNIETEPGGP